MVGGINPFGIFLLFGIAILCAMLVPAILLPWKGFLLYVALGITTALVLWYESEVASIWILFVSIGLIALAIALPIHVLRQNLGTFLRPRPLHIAIAVFAFPIFTILAIEFGKMSWHKHQLPVGFESSKAIYLPRTITAACEISVWQLNDDEASSPNGKVQETKWHQTPYVVHSAGPSAGGSLAKWDRVLQG
ncbi:MAG: hypothetical protein HEQ39_08000 [Rhizobacter sp.]